MSAPRGKLDERLGAAAPRLCRAVTRGHGPGMRIAASSPSRRIGLVAALLVCAPACTTASEDDTAQPSEITNPADTAPTTGARRRRADRRGRPGQRRLPVLDLLDRAHHRHPRVQADARPSARCHMTRRPGDGAASRRTHLPQKPGVSARLSCPAAPPRRTTTGTAPAPSGSRAPGPGTPAPAAACSPRTACRTGSCRRRSARR